VIGILWNKTNTYMINIHKPEKRKEKSIKIIIEETSHKNSKIV